MVGLKEILRCISYELYWHFGYVILVTMTPTCWEIFVSWRHSETCLTPRFLGYKFLRGRNDFWQCPGTTRYSPMSPYLEASSSSPRGQPSKLCSEHEDEDGHPLTFPNLPPELQLEIMSHLNYRELQFLRATSSYFRNLLSPADITRFQKAYIELLFEQEVYAACYPLITSESPLLTDDNSFTPEIRRRHEQFLTCFFCFRVRHISHFPASQSTRRRTKGHVDARKRFCDDCGVEKEKWHPGVKLQFPMSPRVYCLRCKQVKEVRYAWSWRPREHPGLCAICVHDMEQEFTEGEIRRMTAKWARGGKCKWWLLWGGILYILSAWLWGLFFRRLLCS